MRHVKLAAHRNHEATELCGRFGSGCTILRFNWADFCSFGSSQIKGPLLGEFMVCASLAAVHLLQLGPVIALIDFGRASLEHMPNARWRSKSEFCN